MQEFSLPDPSLHPRLFLVPAQDGAGIAICPGQWEIQECCLVKSIYSSACSLVPGDAEPAWQYSGIPVKLKINFPLNAP